MFSRPKNLPSAPKPTKRTAVPVSAQTYSRVYPKKFDVQLDHELMATLLSMTKNISEIQAAKILAAQEQLGEAHAQKFLSIATAAAAAQKATPAPTPIPPQSSHESDRSSESGGEGGGGRGRISRSKKPRPPHQVHRHLKSSSSINNNNNNGYDDNDLHLSNLHSSSLSTSSSSSYTKKEHLNLGQGSELSAQVFSEMCLQVEELKQANESLRKRLSSSESENVKVLRDLEEANNEKVRLERKASSLLNKLSDARSGLKETQTALHSVQFATEQLMQKREQRETQYHKLLAENKLYESKVYELESRCKNAEGLFKNVTGDRDELIRRLQDDLSAAQEGSFPMQSEIVRLRGEKTMLEAELESLRRKMENTEMHFKQNEYSMQADYEGELERLEDKVVHLNSRLEESLSYAQRNSELQSELRSRMMEMQSMETKMAQYDYARKEAEMRLNACERQLQMSESTCREYDIKQREQELAIGKAISELAATRRNASLLENDFKDARSHKEALLAQKKVLKESIAKLSKRLDAQNQVVEKNRNLSQHVASLEEALENSNQRQGDLERAARILTEDSMRNEVQMRELVTRLSAYVAKDAESRQLLLIANERIVELFNHTLSHTSPTHYAIPPIVPMPGYADALSAAAAVGANFVSAFHQHQQQQQQVSPPPQQQHHQQQPLGGGSSLYDLSDDDEVEVDEEGVLVSKSKSGAKRGGANEKEEQVLDEWKARHDALMTSAPSIFATSLIEEDEDENLDGDVEEEVDDEGEDEEDNESEDELFNGEAEFEEGGIEGLQDDKELQAVSAASMQLVTLAISSAIHVVVSALQPSPYVVAIEEEVRKDELLHQQEQISIPSSHSLSSQPLLLVKVGVAKVEEEEEEEEEEALVANVEEEREEDVVEAEQRQQQQDSVHSSSSSSYFPPMDVDIEKIEEKEEEKSKSGASEVDVRESEEDERRGQSSSSTFQLLSPLEEILVEKAKEQVGEISRGAVKEEEEEEDADGGKELALLGGNEASPIPSPPTTPILQKQSQEQQHLAVVVEESVAPASALSSSSSSSTTKAAAEEEEVADKEDSEEAATTAIASSTTATQQLHPEANVTAAAVIEEAKAAAEEEKRKRKEKRKEEKKEAKRKRKEEEKKKKKEKERESGAQEGGEESFFVTAPDQTLAI